MSLEAKLHLAKRLEKELGQTLPAATVEEVIAKVSDILGGYDVEITAQEKDGTSEEFLAAFIAAKQIEGRSQKTLDRYSYLIRRMIEAQRIPIREMTIYNVRSYLMAEKKRGLSDRSLEGMRSVFSSFFGWLQKEGLMAHNPVGNVGTIKYTKKVRKPFSAAEIACIREACSTSRDVALVCFLASTGCRISEVCALDRAINYRSGEITVLGKGNKERKVYVDDVAIMMLDRYLAERKDYSPALFAGKGSDRLQPGGVRHMLEQIGIRAKVDNVHPHRFRRTLATNLISRGMSIQEVAAILGHDNLNTTMTYVYLDQSAVKNSYHKYSA